MQRNVACATFPNNYPGLGFYGKKKRFSIHMPWKERLNATQLKRANDELSAAVIRTREALEISQRRCRAMKIALTVRLTRIGELSGKLERARAQNRALDQECERLVAMVKVAPPSDAATLVPAK